jgi:hypothetical protein
MDNYIWGNSVTAPQIGTNAPTRVWTENDIPYDYNDLMKFYIKLAEDASFLGGDRKNFSDQVISQCRKSLDSNRQLSSERLDQIHKMVESFYT